MMDSEHLLQNSAPVADQMERSADIQHKKSLILQPQIDHSFIRFMHPEVQNSSDSEVEDFYRQRSSKSRIDPNSEFSAEFYYTTNTDVAEAGVDPFLHYLMHGQKEGRTAWLTSWGRTDSARVAREEVDNILAYYSFDFSFYLEQCPELSVLSDRALISHYLVLGWKLGLKPSRNFDPREFPNSHKSALLLKVSPLSLHLRATFLSESSFESASRWQLEPKINELTSESDDEAQALSIVEPFFDFEFYRQNNPDISGSDRELLRHFMREGWRQDRDPSENFSVSYYLESYLDIAENGINPFLHYVMYGRHEGRRPRADEPVQIPVSPHARLTPRHLSSVSFFPDKRFDTSKRRVAPDLESLSLHWIIPDFSKGSGGHMTIFRMIRYLEVLGHRNKIWIENPTFHENKDDAWQTIIKHFQCVEAEVEFIDRDFFEQSGDAVVATSWTTAYLASRAEGFAHKFYFVQDHEPEFHPTSAESLLAKQTYHFDFACICASPWLEGIMTATYGRWARAFDLAFDPDIYYPIDGKRSFDPIASKELFKIAVYARDHTPRRCVPLALMALEMLGSYRQDFEVHFFGQEALSFPKTNFPAINHGVLDSERLSSLYNSCHLGICFSGTNYSLVPQEMMACRLPVLELSGESTKAIFPEEVISLAGPDPFDIMHKITALMENSKGRNAQSDAAFEWVSSRSWQKSAEMVDSIIKERIKSSIPNLRLPSVRRKKNVKLDVVIPTFNGLAQIKSTISALRAQEVYEDIQIYCIDSSSTDGTAQWLKSQRDISVIQIAQTDFQHGRTRNQAAAQGKAPILAFLTQDAIPANRMWATDILKMFGHVKSAAGLTGRHLPYAHHPQYVREEINQHFSAMLKHPLILSKATDPSRWESGDVGWRQLLHFYSDNNSAMRREIFDVLPYPEVEYGEDQLWAKQIIEMGLTKLYAPSVCVFHSHDYTPKEVFERSKTEGEFFALYFGYGLEEETEEELYHKIMREQIAFLNWAKRRKLGSAESSAGYSIIGYKHRGLYEGRSQARRKLRAGMVAGQGSPS